MLWLIQFAFLGLFAGAIARLLHPGRDPMNWFWTMLLGMAGAVVGAFVGNAIGFNTDAGFMRWVFAILGALGLLVLYHLVTAPRARGTTTTAATSDDYRRGVFDDLSRGPRS